MHHDLRNTPSLSKRATRIADDPTSTRSEMHRKHARRNTAHYKRIHIDINFHFKCQSSRPHPHAIELRHCGEKPAVCLSTAIFHINGRPSFALPITKHNWNPECAQFQWQRHYARGYAVRLCAATLKRHNSRGLQVLFCVCWTSN